MAKKDRIKKKQDDSVIHSFAGSLEQAFSEDLSELSGEEDVIVVDVPQKSPKTRKKHRTLYFIVGLLIVIFAVVGIVNTAIATVNGIQYVSNRTEEKNQFRLFLYPVVAIDPPSFEKTENIPNSIMINAALSKILLTQDTSKYNRDMGVIYIPEFDVETAAKSIYGGSITITHETVGSAQNEATYVPDKKAYSVSDSQRTPNYVPQITEISNVGETFTLTVEYYLPTVDIEGLSVKSESEKTMIYTVTKSGERMTITSISLKDVHLLCEE